MKTATNQYNLTAQEVEMLAEQASFVLGNLRVAFNETRIPQERIRLQTKIDYWMTLRGKLLGV